MEIIQVVKRFGTCGGMEEYVFRITEELIKLGIRVTVLCEIQLTRPVDGVNVVQLGEGIKKPRWLSHLIFSKKVSSWVERFSNRKHIIHSHERINCHHVTTIHSTLFNFPKKGFPSFRKYMNEYLEKREISCDSLKKIVPVSHLIADEVTAKYNPLCSRLSDPVSPGVCEIVVKRKKFNSEKPVIGFMGKEWKRKGLPIVIQTWRELRKSIPQIKLCLAGFPAESQIEIKSCEIPEVEVLGFVKTKKDFYSKIDILFHPAMKEAYGMVIAEACSLGIPVICSKQCGIINQESKFSLVSLEANEHPKIWADQIRRMLVNYNSVKYKSNFLDSWNEATKKMLDIYTKVNSNLKNDRL